MGFARELVGHPADTVAKVNDVKVDEKTHRLVVHPEARKQLRFVDRWHNSQGLQLEEHYFFHEKINSKPNIDLHTSIRNGNGVLGLDFETCFNHFIVHAPINALK